MGVVIQDDQGFVRGVQAKRYVAVQNVLADEALACGDGLNIEACQKLQPESCQH